MDDSVATLAERPLILLSNREPYEHVEEPGKGVAVRLPPGGLVSALDPTLRRTHGVWVAWGSGSADRQVADSHGRVPVPPPPEAAEYTLRRVWLDAADIEGYYLGFANSVLWPLCHLLLQHLNFRADQWERYREVNARFADAVGDEARRLGGRPIVWIQDYHFALVADLLRETMGKGEVPELFIHQFWHIPFPPPEILHVLPYGVYQAVLRGLVGNDLMEFHTDSYALNFLACVEKLLPDAVVDREARTVRYRGRTMTVGVFPISIDVARFEELAEAPDVAARATELREQFAARDRQLGVSVDRIDYTKGIPERLRALDLMWQESPELRGRFTMLIVATPSRSELAPYHTLHAEILTQVNDINRRFATHDWTPIVVLTENADAPELAAIYRAADLCLVSSLQDGMNLVAKEFVASQTDERGVLVLSRFTGAAEEIEGALLVNPFNVDGYAAGIRHALEMPLAERRRRMHEMRARLRQATIFDWLNAITDRVATLSDAAAAAADRR
jgi:alpha,alpha-trehalose-phosphate synthase [UDP-forming]